jgi:hypothetical protein
MMSRNGTTSSGVVGVPGYTERTYESRQRARQLQVIANPPEDEVARRWRLHEEHWAAREAKWKADDQRRQDQIRAEDKEQRERQQRELEQRTHAKLLAVIFEQHGASDVEQAKVCRLVEQRPKEQRTLELYEVTLLRLRAELEGPVPNAQIDWRSATKK